MVPDLDDANAYRARAALLSRMCGSRGEGRDPRALLVLLACELTQLRASATLPAATQQTLAVSSPRPGRVAPSRPAARALQTPSARDERFSPVFFSTTKPACAAAPQLEAVQLYAPLSHAIGFGDAFYELETLAYDKLFPESLRRLRRWYSQVWPDAHDLVPRLCAQLRSQLLDAPSL
eukprot:265418-Prymnesium_polylepis.2